MGRERPTIDEGRESEPDAGSWSETADVKEFAGFEVKKDIEDIEPFLERVGEGGTGRVDPFGFLN